MADRRRPASYTAWAVGVNLAVWHVGLLLLMGFDLEASLSGARITWITLQMAILLVPVAIMEFFVRRYLLPEREDRLFGPAFAAGAPILIVLELLIFCD